MKKTLIAGITALTLVYSFPSHAAFVDYGLILGSFENAGSTVGSGQGLFELGVFSGYNDTLGTTFFSGKDYSTLRSSWTVLSGSQSAIDSSGRFYKSAVDLVTTPVNTRLFAWGFSTTTASSSANWTIISGTIADTSAYGPVWLAVAPSDITVNAIELGTSYNTMYANSNLSNAFQSNLVAPTELSSNVSVVPEPSTYALMALGGLVLFFMVRRRKVQA